jgi:outer membrane protein OmpA-like peptidoglycan-associated protein
MARSALRWLGGAVAIACVAVPNAGAREPVVGVDLAAAVPVSTFQRTADAGGAILPFVGYRFGDRYFFTPLVQAQFAAFPNNVDPDLGPESEDQAASLFAITAGARLGMKEEKLEIYFTAQGGYYTDISGPINDQGEGFAIGGGVDYELTPGNTLGLFLRRDQSSMRAARDTTDDLTYLLTGLSYQHRFLAPPPPPAPVVAEAPPPPPAPPPKKKIVLRGVNFDFDRANIRADAEPILDAAVSTLQAEQPISIVVEGHTDSTGADQYNQDLSIRRATAVRDYLQKKGIDAGRMTIEGYGETKPVASNDTAEGRAQNRRVELRVAE